MQESSEHKDATNGTAEVDLSNCDREPIHVPGSIQPHGVMLSLDESDMRILQVSSNCQEFFGIDSTDLLGNSLIWILGTAQTDSFRETLTSRELRPSNPMKLTVGRGDKS